MADSARVMVIGGGGLWRLLPTRRAVPPSAAGSWVPSFCGCASPPVSAAARQVRSIGIGEAKLGRIEVGRAGLEEHDVKQLLELYGIHDEQSATRCWPSHVRRTAPAGSRRTAAPCLPGSARTWIWRRPHRSSARTRSSSSPGCSRPRTTHAPSSLMACRGSTSRGGSGASSRAAAAAAADPDGVEPDTVVGGHRRGRPVAADRRTGGDPRAATRPARRRAAPAHHGSGHAVPCRRPCGRGRGVHDPALPRAGAA